MSRSIDLICVCGRRSGMHRWGTYQCPNPDWRPHSGKPEFLQETFRARVPTGNGRRLGDDAAGNQR